MSSARAIRRHSFRLSRASLRLKSKKKIEELIDNDAEQYLTRQFVKGTVQIIGTDLCPELSAGCFRQIVEWLILQDPSTKSGGVRVRSFLLNYRTFKTSKELLDVLSEIYESYQLGKDTTSSPRTSSPRNPVARVRSASLSESKLKEPLRRSTGIRSTRKNVSPPRTRSPSSLRSSQQIDFDDDDSDDGRTVKFSPATSPMSSPSTTPRDALKPSGDAARRSLSVLVSNAELMKALESKLVPREDVSRTAASGDKPAQQELRLSKEPAKNSEAASLPTLSVPKLVPLARKQTHSVPSLNLTAPATLNIPAGPKTCNASMSYTDEYIQRTKAKFKSLLQTWVQIWYKVDFEKKPLFNKLLKFVETHFEDADSFKLLILRKQRESEKLNQRKEAPVVSSLTTDDNFDLLAASSTDIATQLTLIEAEHYANIQPPEFLYGAWKMEEQEKAPNLMKIVQRFNETSKWVATRIVLANKKDQAKLIRKFVSIAKKMQQLRNYNGMFEILSGLNITAVQRLKTMKTISQTDSALEKLENLMSPSSNFKNYRAMDFSPPTLPYLAVSLRDLTFINDGNDDFMGEDLINFQKMTMFDKQIQTLLECQTPPYSEHEKVKLPIHKALTTLNYRSEDELLRWVKTKHERKEAQKKVACAVSAWAS